MCAQQVSVFSAQSVRAVASLEDKVAKHIMDRSFPIAGDFVRDAVNGVIMNFTGRSPRPALNAKGVFQATDLDLLSFLVPLAVRRAIIEIPTYENRRQRVRKESERKIGTNNFGAVTSLVSNQDVFSFSVRLFDQTIAVCDQKTEGEATGAHRSYMLVDVDGTWHDGWSKLVWNPTVKENSFLTDHGLWTGNAVQFQHYVHPNRRQSIYGAPYLRLKMLSARLADEASFYQSEVQRLEALGMVLPAGVKGPVAVVEAVGGVKSIKVETMEMVLDLPDFTGQYPSVEVSEAGIKEAYERQKYLTYSLRPLVQFVVRSDEAAFFRFGVREGFVASWMKGAVWQSGYRLPRGRVDWNRLELAPAVALRYRIKTVTQPVAA
jgi:hypothetical protein